MFKNNHFTKFIQEKKEYIFKTDHNGIDLKDVYDK